MTWLALTFYMTHSDVIFVFKRGFKFSLKAVILTALVSLILASIHYLDKPSNEFHQEHLKITLFIALFPTACVAVMPWLINRKNHYPGDCGQTLRINEQGIEQHIPVEFASGTTHSFFMAWKNIKDYKIIDSPYSNQVEIKIIGPSITRTINTRHWMVNDKEISTHNDLFKFKGESELMVHLIKQYHQ